MGGGGANGIGFEGVWGLVSLYVSTFDGEFEYGVADGNTDGGGLRYWFVDCGQVAAADSEDDGDDVADDWGVTGGSCGGGGGDEGLAWAGVGEWGAASVGFDSDGFWVGGRCGDFLSWDWVFTRGCRLAPFFFDDARLVGDLVWLGSGVGVLGGGDFDGDGEFDFSGAERGGDSSGGIFGGAW